MVFILNDVNRGDFSLGMKLPPASWSTCPKITLFTARKLTYNLSENLSDSI